MKTIIRLSFLIFLLLSCTKDNKLISDSEKEEGAFIDDWTYEFFTQNSTFAKFKLWVPKNVKPKAILVLSIGGGANGTNLVDAKEWRDFANKEGVALLGIHLTVSFDIAPNTLLRGLGKITKARNIEYVSDLPFLLRGHSFGGVFSQVFAAQYESRTVGFANIKGSASESAQKMPPGLLIIGDKDLEYRRSIINESFLLQRKNKNITCLAVAPNSGHSVDNSDPFIRGFFTAILKKRLVNGKLIDLKEEDMLLGKLDNFETYTFAKYPYSKEGAACLIDEDFKNEWIKFVN